MLEQVWTQRQEVNVPSGAEQCAAWLSIPDGDGPFGCVVMGHGFSLTKADRLDQYADVFAAAGLAVLAFDYRYFGDSTGAPRQHFRRRLQVEDFANAVGFARAQPQIDASRIAVWGFSFGGAHALEVAAADVTVAAAIALCPFVDGFKRVRATRPALAAWLIPRAIADQAGRHNLVPVTAQPGERGTMSLPGEADGFFATVPEGSPWRNEISPAIFLSVGTYRPVRLAPQLLMPLWVGLGDQDITTDAGAIQRLAARAPNGELARYPADHFGPFQDPLATEIAHDQVNFLRRTKVLPKESAVEIPTFGPEGD